MSRYTDFLKNFENAVLQSKRHIEEIELIAVSKRKSINNILSVINEGQVSFGDVNKWSPADIYLATDIARSKISKEIQKTKPKTYSFIDLNILTSNLIDSGDLLPLSLKKTTKDVQLQKVNCRK